MPLWRNGKRAGFRTQWPQGLAGSTPAGGIWVCRSGDIRSRLRWLITTGVRLPAPIRFSVGSRERGTAAAAPDQKGRRYAYMVER